jgi:hypothetical protein
MSSVYPIYLVIDASQSMNDEIEALGDELDIPIDDETSASEGKREKLIDYALNIPKAFYEEYENNVSLEKQLLVSVIAFNKTAEVVHRLSSVKELEGFKKLEASSKTYYSEAFKKVKEQIEADYASPASVDWKIPAVIFVTDGGPNDPADVRSYWFEQLVPRKPDGSIDRTKFENSPHFIVFAFRDVRRDVLKRYVSDPDFLFIADPNASLRIQFNQIIKQITETTFTSVYADYQSKSKNWTPVIKKIVIDVNARDPQFDPDDYNQFD